jgi:hypothetical protein
LLTGALPSLNNLSRGSTDLHTHTHTQLHNLLKTEKAIMSHRDHEDHKELASDSSQMF